MWRGKSMKRKTKGKKLKVILKRAESLSEEEAQRKLNEVFDILLDETDRTIKAQKQIAS